MDRHTNTISDQDSTRLYHSAITRCNSISTVYHQKQVKPILNWKLVWCNRLFARCITVMFAAGKLYVCLKSGGRRYTWQLTLVYFLGRPIQAQMQYRHKQAIDTDPASECIGAAHIRQCGVRSRLTWLMANWLKYDKHFCFTFLLGGAGQQLWSISIASAF